MFFLGHLGIGRELVRPFSKGLCLRVIYLGAVLPDLLDKPLYYGLSLLTGKHGSELSLITGTRTIGHTALLLVTIGLISTFKKSPFLAALALGIGSHLMLDGFGDYLNRDDGSSLTENLDTSYLLWPFFGSGFPKLPYSNVQEHLSTIHRPFIFWGELIGFGLLMKDYYLRKAPR